MANAELVLAPVMDRNATKRTEAQIAQALENAGRKGSVSMQKDIKKQLKKGVNDGVMDGVKDSMPTMRNIGAMIAVGAAAMVASTIDKTLGGLEENIDRILGKLDSVREIASDAKAFGIDESRYAALNIMGAAQGLDISDISGIMTGFAASLSDERMSAFKSIRESQGMEKAFFDFLSSTGKLQESQRQQQLIDVFGEDDMRLVSRFMNPMMQVKGQLNLESLYQQMTGNQLNLSGLAGGMERTAEANRYMNQQTSNVLAQQLISGVSLGQVQNVAAAQASQRRVDAASMSAMSLQVKAKITADAITVKQIEAGIMAANAVIDYSEMATSFANDPSLKKYAELMNPNLKQTGTDLDALRNIVGMANPATAANNLIGQYMPKMVELLQQLVDDGKDSKDFDQAATYRGY